MEISPGIVQRPEVHYPKKATKIPQWGKRGDGDTDNVEHEEEVQQKLDDSPCFDAVGIDAQLGGHTVGVSAGAPQRYGRPYSGLRGPERSLD